ncbi:FAR1-related sequence 5-like protein [Tanacetum coccineum]
MAVFDWNQPASSLSEEDVVAASSSINTGFDSHVVSVSSSINSGCDSFASHDDNARYDLLTLSADQFIGVPRVSDSCSYQLLGLLFDSLDECIEMYRKYASEAGFGIRLSCQKRLKCGYVKQKYIVCNREGCPKDVWLNTLDPKKNDRQVERSSEKALFSGVEFLFYYLKAANANIGAVRAHNLYTGLKGSSSLVHGTQTEFKNFTRGVNCFIGDSDALRCFITDGIEIRKYASKRWCLTFEERNNESLWMVSFELLQESLLSVLPEYSCHRIRGAMRLAVAAEFLESKHMLCMWNIMQKIPAKIVSRIYDDTDFKDKFDEGCTVCIIDEEKLKPVGLPEVIDKESTSENVDEEINLHQKVTGHYKVLYNKGDGPVSCCCQPFLFGSGIYVEHILCIQELQSVLYSRSVYIEALDQGFDPT